MKHRATAKFWGLYKALPVEVQRLAQKNFELLKQDPSHPSPHFKKVGRFWSVRAGIHFRALAVEDSSTLVWFWIGLIRITNVSLALVHDELSRSRHPHSELSVISAKS